MRIWPTDELMLYGLSTDRTGIIVFLAQHCRSEKPLVCPWVTELYLLIYDTFGIVLPCYVVYICLTAIDLFHVEHTWTMTVIDIVAADLRERILLVIQFYLHSAGQRAEAEPVGADISAGLFNKLYKAAVIDLGADYRYPRADSLSSGSRVFISSSVSSSLSIMRYCGITYVARVKTWNS